MSVFRNGGCDGSTQSGPSPTVRVYTKGAQGLRGPQGVPGRYSEPIEFRPPFVAVETTPGEVHVSIDPVVLCQMLAACGAPPPSTP